MQCRRIYYILYTCHGVVQSGGSRYPSYVMVSVGRMATALHYNINSDSKLGVILFWMCMPKMGITVMTQKDSFCEKLEQIINQFPKHPMNVLLGNFIAKLGKGNIFKPTVGHEISHENSNYNGISQLCQIKIVLIRAQCSCNKTYSNTLRPVLMERITVRLITSW